MVLLPLRCHDRRLGALSKILCWLDILSLPVYHYCQAYSTENRQKP